MTVKPEPVIIHVLCLWENYMTRRKQMFVKATTDLSTATAEATTVSITSITDATTMVSTATILATSATNIATTDATTGPSTASTVAITTTAEGTTQTSTSETETTTGTSMATTEIATTAMKGIKIVQLSIPGNYSAVVGNDKTGFLNSVKPQLAAKMSLDPTRITNMEVKEGEPLIFFDHICRNSFVSVIFIHDWHLIIYPSDHNINSFDPLHDVVSPLS